MSDRMTADRLDTVIEEIVTTIRDFGADDKGLHTIRCTFVRPSGDRCFINYTATDPEDKTT